IVVKPMASRLRHIAMFSGTTILGDGAVILIIDPNGVMQRIGITEASRRTTQQERAAEPEQAVSEAMLVFRAGSPNPKAVPLSLVTRLEEIDVRTIETASGRALVQYRGQLMPLLPVNDDTRVRTSGMQPLLVFS